MIGARMLMGAAANAAVFPLAVNASTSNYNARAAFDALYGPAAVVPGITVVVTIAPGVIIDGGNSGDAFDTGGWGGTSTSSLVTFLLINNGSIYGRGGSARAGLPGGTGNNAIRISAGGLRVQIDNTNGEIFAGGGGGGCGGSAGSNISLCQGGGGGGGRGKTGGSGANASGGGAAGQSGSDGGQNGAGDGGAGGAVSFYGTKGGKGGKGGGWGNPGAAGNDGTGSPSGGGRSGGAAGYAIAWTTAFAAPVLTWLAGNNTTQVKGSIGT